MKSFFCAMLITWLWPIMLKAQTTDYITTRCAYKLSWIKDTSKPKDYKEDFMYLDIRSKLSEFYSYNSFAFDSMMKADRDKGLSDMEILAKRAQYGKRGVRYHIYKNYPAGKITVTDFLGIDQYSYEETLKAQTWVMGKEQAVILNYKCQMASCDFGGRHYIAWFTKEVPIGTGPWKFSGLPGLILKVEDSKKQFIFEIVGLQQIRSKMPITVPNLKAAIETTKSQFLALEKKLYDDPASFLKNTGGFQITSKNPNAAKSRPYNPIELN